MTWEKLKSFGDFEGDNYGTAYYPLSIDRLMIHEIVDEYIQLIAEFPGYKHYRIICNEIKRRHCSNCNPICEWVLEGTYDE